LNPPSVFFLGPVPTHYYNSTSKAALTDERDALQSELEATASRERAGKAEAAAALAAGRAALSEEHANVVRNKLITF